MIPIAHIFLAAIALVLPSILAAEEQKVNQPSRPPVAQSSAADARDDGNENAGKRDDKALAWAGALAGLVGGIVVAGLNALVAYLTRGHESTKQLREIAHTMTMEQWKFEKERWEDWKSKLDVWNAESIRLRQVGQLVPPQPSKPKVPRPLALIFADMIRLADLIANRGGEVSAQDLILYQQNSSKTKAELLKALGDSRSEFP